MIVGKVGSRVVKGASEMRRKWGWNRFARRKTLSSQSGARRLLINGRIEFSVTSSFAGRPVQAASCLSFDLIEVITNELDIGPGLGINGPTRIAV